MLRRRPVAVELRLRAQAEARLEAQRRFQLILLRFFVGAIAVTGLFLAVATDVLAREAVIEEVSAPQLEKLIKTRDFVAVFWYSRHCRLCDEALDELEGIDDDAEKFSVSFVKINDKRLAKSYGIKRFPSLSFFRDGEITLFDGDLTDEDDVLDFLTSENLLILPDKIEEISAAALEELISVEPYVTALFYDDSDRSEKVLDDLENIDDEAEIFKIRFVRIRDASLAEEYSLSQLPSLVYFRNGIPVVYHGDLMDEVSVLEWLIHHQTSIDEVDDIENVNELELDIMIRTVDRLLVLFLDNKKKSKQALLAMEEIDDDCDKSGVLFVAATDPEQARSAYGVTTFPTLVYYEAEIPSVFGGDVKDPEEVLEWVTNQVEGADIESVEGEMLEKMVSREVNLVVLFYSGRAELKGDPDTLDVVAALEEIDDDLDQQGVQFVKTGDESVARDYGIERLPALVVFQNGVPNLYEGTFGDQNVVLSWLLAAVSESGRNSVEVVTDAMIERLIERRQQVAVLFYQKGNRNKVLEAFDAVGEEVAQRPPEIYLVKTTDASAAKEFGIVEFPALVLFVDGQPNLYRGELSDPYEVMDWLESKASSHEHIESVNGRMLERLVSQEHEPIVAYVYEEEHRADLRLLQELENVDDELEDRDIHLVKLPSDSKFNSRHGIHIIPALVLFRDGEAIIYKGDIGSEKTAVQWILDTLEED